MAKDAGFRRLGKAWSSQERGSVCGCRHADPASIRSIGMRREGPCHAMKTNWDLGEQHVDFSPSLMLVWFIGLNVERQRGNACTPSTSFTKGSYGTSPRGAIFAALPPPPPFPPP